MCKIIQFPQKTSNGYNNLSALITIADNLDSLNFYIESITQLEKMGALFPGERERLTEQGRSKRLELSAPQPHVAEKADKPGMYTYTPEMGQQKPKCQMEASCGYYGSHMYIDTPLEIKGHGIKFIKNYSDRDFVKSKCYKVGWNHYQVTNRAYEKLKEQYTISLECCLD